MVGVGHYNSTKYRESTGIHRGDIMDIFAVNNFVAMSNGNLHEEKGENIGKRR